MVYVGIGQTPPAMYIRIVAFIVVFTRKRAEVEATLNLLSNPVQPT